MNYQNDVSVIVEDDVIKVLDEDGTENTIIFLKSKPNGKSKIVDNRSSNSKSNGISILLKNESYIERLYQDSLKEIIDFDKMIIKEAFSKELTSLKMKKPTLLSILKNNFLKKQKQKKI